MEVGVLPPMYWNCKRSIRALRTALPIVFWTSCSVAQTGEVGSIAKGLREQQQNQPSYAWLIHTERRPEGFLEAIDAALLARSDRPSVILAPLGKRQADAAMFYAVVPPSPTNDSEIPLCVELNGAVQGYWLLTPRGAVQGLDPRGQSGCLIFTAGRNTRFARGELNNADLKKRTSSSDMGALLEAHYASLAARTLAECAEDATRSSADCEAAAHFAHVSKELQHIRSAQEAQAAKRGL